MAVEGLVDTLREMALRNAEVPVDQRIEFRIGVNLGDIMNDEEDIYGDGVNVAARLEALAPPGRICVSRVARDQVRDKLNFTFDDRGEQQVKNRARPVRVFDVKIAGETMTLTSYSGAVAPLPLPDKPSIDRHGFGLSTLLCIAVRRSELGQQLELLPLRPQKLLEVLAEDPVQLLMQLDDLDLGLQIDLIIQAGG
jgi:Adenylate and Guanylate cyclase catalytic domain